MAADSTLGDETGEEITPSDTGAGAYDPRSAAAIGFWRLVGTEPFWGVRIDTSGIVFSSPEVPDGIRLGLSVPVLDSDTLRFNSTTERVPAHDIEV